jgi:hypothetical protein
MQMARRLFWEVRPDGSVCTDRLHLEGFACILWDALRSSEYPTPPTYEAMETTQLGVPRCRVRVTVPLHPDHPEWADLSTDVVSIQLMETLEVAALGVLNSFCDQHPDKVSTSLVERLPTVDPQDPVWRHCMGTWRPSGRYAPTRHVEGDGSARWCTVPSTGSPQCCFHCGDHLCSQLCWRVGSVYPPPALPLVWLHGP